MSIHSIPRKHSDPSAPTDTASHLARQRTINPLWMVTFAAGLLFGMLAVLLTAG